MLERIEEKRRDSGFVGLDQEAVEWKWYLRGWMLVVMESMRKGWWPTWIDRGRGTSFVAEV